MLNGIKDSGLLMRNGLFGMGVGGIADLLFFDHLLISGFGLLLSVMITYIYLIKKHGRTNLNK